MNDNYKQFLDNFSKQDLLTNDRLERNIFEITRYPHYENVVSNILSFFFDSEEEHEYRDCWARALMNSYASKLPLNNIDINSINVSNVEREYSNGTDKRIDLLVDCDNFIILIENKIYASFYNDMNIYASMVKNYQKENDKQGIPIVKIVLSLFPVNNIKHKDIANVTYEELFKEIEKLEDQYQPDSKWKLIGNEFIESIKRRKRNMKLDQNWNEFAKENKEQFNDFITKYENEKKRRFDLIKELGNKIEGLQVKKNIYVYQGSNDPYCSVVVNVVLKDNTNLAFETYVMKRPTGKEYEEYDELYLAVWNRNNKAYDLDYVVKALNDPEARKHHTPGWGNQYILNVYKLDSLNLDEIAETIVNYEKIARAV